LIPGALVASLLSLPVDRYPVLAMSPQKQKDETLHLLAKQVTTLAAAQPVLLIFEDAHWIDPTSQELLDVLVAMLAGHAVLAVITHRPEYQPPWLGQGHVTPLALNRLGRADAAAMVARVSNSVLPDDVLDQIVTRCDGVPLFVEELTQTVAEGGEAGVPETLQDSLMARLDRLGAAKEVAQIGACIGRAFSRELLAAVSPFDGAALEQALRQLVDSGLIYGSKDRYVFKHALVQDSAYDSLLRGRRQALHREIAQSLETRFPESLRLEPELIATHYEAAGLPEPSARHWYQAGQHAAARSAAVEAQRHFKRGLALFGELPQTQDTRRLELDYMLGMAVVLRVTYGYNHSELVAAYERARSEPRTGRYRKAFPDAVRIVDEHCRAGEVLGRLRDDARVPGDCRRSRRVPLSARGQQNDRRALCREGRSQRIAKASGARRCPLRSGATCGGSPSLWLRSPGFVAVLSVERLLASRLSGPGRELSRSGVIS
ncbi:MAG: hypothetical protein QGF53_07640, partial [Alphaproteobacteria bacterium]|nr:hypothetical protein [Alphaproteobacteria bacterium]